MRPFVSAWRNCGAAQVIEAGRGSSRTLEPFSGDDEASSAEAAEAPMPSRTRKRLTVVMFASFRFARPSCRPERAVEPLVARLCSLRS
jgi:hypothetical protein